MCFTDSMLKKNLNIEMQSVMPHLFLLGSRRYIAFVADTALSNNLT